ncbi:TRPM2-like protein, partial [Mya arenaria]
MSTATVSPGTSDIETSSRHHNTNKRKCHKQSSNCSVFEDGDKKMSESETTTKPEFHDIDFVEYGGPLKKFVSLHVDTKPKVVVDMLTKDSKLGKPRVLLSIIGGTRFSQLNKRLKTAFSQGLIKFVNTTDSWIFTSGFQTGVNQCIGEAVRDNGIMKSLEKSLVTVGIAPFG